MERKIAQPIKTAGNLVADSTSQLSFPEYKEICAAIGLDDVKDALEEMELVAAYAGVFCKVNWATKKIDAGDVLFTTGIQKVNAKEKLVMQRLGRILDKDGKIDEAAMAHIAKPTTAVLFNEIKFQFIDKKSAIISKTFTEIQTAIITKYATLSDYGVAKEGDFLLTEQQNSQFLATEIQKVFRFLAKQQMPMIDLLHVVKFSTAMRDPNDVNARGSRLVPFLTRGDNVPTSLKKLLPAQNLGPLTAYKACLDIKQARGLTIEQAKAEREGLGGEKKQQKNNKRGNKRKQNQNNPGLDKNYRSLVGAVTNALPKGTNQKLFTNIIPTKTLEFAKSLMNTSIQTMSTPMQFLQIVPYVYFREAPVHQQLAFWASGSILTLSGCNFGNVLFGIRNTTSVDLDPIARACMLGIQFMDYSVLGAHEIEIHNREDWDFTKEEDGRSSQPLKKPIRVGMLHQQVKGARGRGIGQNTGMSVGTIGYISPAVHTAAKEKYLRGVEQKIDTEEREKNRAEAMGAAVKKVAEEGEMIVFVAGMWNDKVFTTEVATAKVIPSYKYILTEQANNSYSNGSDLFKENGTQVEFKGTDLKTLAAENGVSLAKIKPTELELKAGSRTADDDMSELNITLQAKRTKFTTAGTARPKARNFDEDEDMTEDEDEQEYSADHPLIKKPAASLNFVNKAKIQFDRYDLELVKGLKVNAESCLKLAHKSYGIGSGLEEMVIMAIYLSTLGAQARTTFAYLGQPKKENNPVVKGYLKFRKESLKGAKIELSWYTQNLQKVMRMAPQPRSVPMETASARPPLLPSPIQSKFTSTNGEVFTTSQLAKQVAISSMYYPITIVESGGFQYLRTKEGVQGSVENQGEYWYNMGPAGLQAVQNI